jgi:ribosomal-protein-alanine N-acetyltransferase
LALYRRHGFAQSGVRKGYYVKPDGMRANALMMRRALS